MSGLNPFPGLTQAQVNALITVFAANSPTLVTPTIASFLNAQHSHQSAASGGSLDAAAIGTGLLANARVNFAAPAAIGSGTPATGAFTTLSGSSDLTLSGAPGKIKPAADSTTALELTNAAGTAILTADTSNSHIGIGITPHTTIINSGVLDIAAGFQVTDPVNNAVYTQLGVSAGGANSNLTDLDIVTADGTSASTLRFGRHVNTTLGVAFQILVGNGTSTVNHLLKGTGDTQINVAGTGNLALGLAGTTAARTHIFGRASGDIALIVQNAASSPGDAQQWRANGSPGTVQAKVDNAGQGFFAGLNLTDATNIVLGTTTGTKIGTAATQKLAFYNATPIAQRSGAAQAAVAATASTQTTPFGYTTQAQADAIVTLVNELRAWAVVQGFIKGSA